MTSKLGSYWSVMHRRANDYDYFRRTQPSVFKIMDGGPPDYQWARENLPNSLIVARDWALSEQHDDMRRDPEGTGIRHAQEWNDHAGRLGFERAKTLVLGINEPRVWEAGVAEALRVYTIALCDAARLRNLRVGAMQLGVGWPNNTGPDTPPDWSPWHGVEDAILRGNHVLVTHEYWADGGPMENWGWWGGRTLKCSWRVPFLIGECGIDMYVKSPQFEGLRGWYGRKTAEQYASELAEYTGRMSVDSRFLGCAVFASDFASHEWYSFDVEPAYQAILATPIPVYPPVVTPPTLPVMYVVVPAGANIRTRPVNGDILIAVPYGDAVGVTGADGAWSSVRYQGITGWMLTALLGHTKPVTVPPVVTPAPTEGDWERSIAWVLEKEGGFQNDLADKGNYYNGKLVGTKYGISAASWGGQYDIPNLTIEQAKAIYHEHYWLKSGANNYAWPLCLLVLDSAVLHGVGAAQQWLATVGPNPYLFAALRLKIYTQLDNGDRFWRGWVLRVSDLLEEIGKANASIA